LEFIYRLINYCSYYRDGNLSANAFFDVDEELANFVNDSGMFDWNSILLNADESYTFGAYDSTPFTHRHFLCQWPGVLGN